MKEKRINPHGDVPAWTSMKRPMATPTQMQTKRDKPKEPAMTTISQSLM